MAKSGLLKNPLIQSLIKSQLPSIIDNLGEAEQALIDYINSFELQGSETEIVLFSQVNNQKLYFCIGAYTGKEFTRLIQARPAKEFIKDILTND